MRLRNSKNYIYKNTLNYKSKSIIGIVRECEACIPPELLRIISSYHHCSDCFKNGKIHCNYCNICDINDKTHIRCDICDNCYSKYTDVIFTDINGDEMHLRDVKILHIHCTVCGTAKKYCFRKFHYYCTKCC